MKIRVRRIAGLTGAQLGLGIFLGVTGGYYIWKPVLKTAFEEAQQETKNKDQFPKNVS